MTPYACVSCGNSLQPNDRFCSACGALVGACRTCGASLVAGDRFCPQCGMAVQSGTGPNTPAPGVGTAPGLRTVMGRLGAMSGIGGMGGYGTGGGYGPPMVPAAPADPWQQVLARLRGATMGEFEIVREVGRGGMAAVYLAKDLTLGRKVAIKVMAPALLAGEGMVERFTNEARTVAGLSHPNIISVYAVRQSGDLQFFVMKFVEGRSLDHILKDVGGLPIPVVRGLLFMIGSALGYAHRRNVVHRDIKPGNILLDEEGNAIVTDFGIAKVADNSRLTGTGVVIGTPTYISPEQCYARPVTAGSDQYSLGVVAYEMITGRVPFEGPPFTVMQAHTEKPVPPIRQARSDCPPELETAIMRMLAKDPADRWPSIQHALAGVGATALPDGDPARIHLAQLAVAGLTRTDEILATPVTPITPISGSSRISASTPAPPPYVAAVAILASPDTVEVGDVFNLGASARNAAGDTMPNARLTWTSDNPLVVAVDAATGVVRAVAPGTATISVSAEGVHNAVIVAVGPRRVAAVNVSIPPGSVRVGDRVHLAAVPEDKHHGPIAQPVRWLSEDSAVASVGDDGTLTAKAAGSVLVWAEADGVRGTARVEISPASVAAIRLGPVPESVEAGDTFTITATPLDPDGNELRGRVCTWSSGNDAVASVSEHGVVQTRRSGTVQLVCTCEGKTAVATVGIGIGAVQSLFISPPPPVIEAGVPFTLEAWVVSESGAVIDSSEVAWQSSDPEIARVAPGGRVRPRAPGDVTITASVGGVDAQVGFAVSPSTTGYVPGESEEPVEEVPVPALAGAGLLTTSDFMAGDAAVSAMPASFTGDSPSTASSDGGVAVVDAPPAASNRGAARRTNRMLLIGLPLVVVGVAAAAYFANRGGSTGGEATGAVTPTVTEPSGPPPGTVNLAGIPAAVIVGDTFSLSATIVDSSRTPVPTAAANWRSSNLDIVDVDSASGLVTGIAAGEATITADVAGKQATAQIVIAARPSGPIARIVVAPARLRIVEGKKQQLTANLVDSANAPVVGAVTWQVEDTTIASVDSTSGNVTARKAGRTNVVASSGGVTTKVALTVAAKEGETDQEAIRGQVDQFVTALNGRNAQRVQALYLAESAQDKQNLAFLLETFKRAGSNFRATGLNVAAPEIGWTEATANFTVRASWKPAAGAVKNQTVNFRATLERSGNAWKLLGVRALDKLE
jgi:serine/threonine protein kinase/uncharacterized protein YjdB